MALIQELDAIHTAKGIHINTLQSPIPWSFPSLVCSPTCCLCQHACLPAKPYANSTDDLATSATVENISPRLHNPSKFSSQPRQKCRLYLFTKEPFSGSPHFVLFIRAVDCDLGWLTVLIKILYRHWPKTNGLPI